MGLWDIITKKSSTRYTFGRYTLGGHTFSHSGSEYIPSPTEKFTVGMGNITSILEAIPPVVVALLLLYGTTVVFRDDKNSKEIKKHGKNR